MTNTFTLTSKPSTYKSEIVEEERNSRWLDDKPCSCSTVEAARHQVNMPRGNSLVVQWLVLYTVTDKSPGSVPDWGTKVPQAVWQGQKKK